ncbi:EAL domain-containing protein [Pseudoalteromonas sp. MMG010]|uniref:EAL domain-containing protein n=1 Tax=Pseudoalteromonas sp. MMG010 TaxID=2822685 RepID=UPI001B39E3DE|nr:EAL domain-containing protein [Pseudoalteromonas sp. MMG010]MBQ4833526.1 EAL domain-containing protein [Pseudoalteromonas sp. MMG010]
MRTLFALNTIRKKLLFILMSVAIASSLIITSVFTAYELNTAKQEQKESLQSLLNMLAPNIITALLFDDSAAVQEQINPILSRSDIVLISVIPQNNTKPTITAKSKKENISTKSSDTIVSMRLEIDRQILGQLIIRADHSFLENKARFYIKFIICLLMVTFALSFFLSLFFRRRFLTPILYLAEIAKKVTSSNDYTLRVNKTSQDEVGELTTCFNSMLHTIEQRESSLEKQVKLRTDELQTANEQLHKYAYHDGLTDIPNRRFFYEKLHSLVSTPNMKFALFFVDLDGFKEINDTLGHDFGDLLLYQVAKRFSHCIRADDLVARLGGDEFTLIVNDIENTERAAEIGKKLLDSLIEPIHLKNEKVFVTGSIGIAFYPADGDTVEALVKRADQAMYLSKSKGRNCFQFFTLEMEQEAIKNRLLIDELRAALEAQQFELYYQPIFDISGTIVKKAEALIRWHHPTRGLLGPNEFIDTAEESGLIKQIGLWIKQQAIADISEFYQTGEQNVQISINTSALEIDKAGKWAEKWIQAINEHNLPANAILIEITENTLMAPNSAIKKHLKRLSELNIDVAIDDFGVGYSSLAYLQRLHIDILKIDKSFIDDLEYSDSSLALVTAIITMAHSLNVRVVAEGVETFGQYKKLVALNCDFIQGYIFSKPLTKQEFLTSYLSSKATEERSVGIEDK